MIGQKADRAWREATWVFMLSRLIMLAVGFFALNRVLSTRPGQALSYADLLPSEARLYTHPNDVMAYLLSWWRWDVAQYTRIASGGYWPGGTVFFPLWPIIMHISGLLFRPFVSGGNTAYYFGGLICANILFYIAIVMLYKLIAREFSRKTARLTILFLALSPYALFFATGYTESLFLFLCVAVFFFLQREGYKNWYLAGIFAALAALTRESGFFLIIPFIVLLIQRYWSVRKDLLAHWRSIVARILPLALLPLGVGCYMLYLYVSYGDPLLFITAAVNWDRHPVLPGVSIYVEIVSLITGALPVNVLYNNLTDLLFAVVTGIIILISLRKMPLKYSLFSLASWLFFNCTVTYKSFMPLMSYPRYATVIFPLFMLIASLLEKRQKLQYLVLIIYSLLLSVNVSLFVTNQWVA